MTDRPFGTFFLPGPTEVRPEILAAMTRPMIAHRGKAFEELFARLEAGLRDVLLTARPGEWRLLESVCQDRQGVRSRRRRRRGAVGEDRRPQRRRAETRRASLC